MIHTLQILVALLIALIMAGCSNQLPPEQRALELEEESQALGGNQSVQFTIHNWVKERGEEVKPIGWDVSKENDRIYLVSYKYEIYSFKEGTGERGFFFEVDLNSRSVRNVTKEVTQKLGALSPSFKKEEEISEQLMQKLGEDGKMLTGGAPKWTPSPL